ncbi:MAG: NadS family protein [Deinococcales bacterium]
MMENSFFETLSASLQEAIEIKQGKRPASRQHVIEEPSAKVVRTKLNLSREKFSALIGVSERTVEKWEQGIAKPSGAAKSLLIIAAKNPQAVLDALL